MKKLRVHKFGPIQNAEIELKDLMVFIGPPASGKSMLAKLVMGFDALKSYSGISMLEFSEYSSFADFLQHYNIDFTIAEDSKFTFTWTMEDKEILWDFDIDAKNIYEPISTHGESPNYQLYKAYNTSQRILEDFFSTDVILSREVLLKKMEEDDYQNLVKKLFSTLKKARPALRENIWFQLENTFLSKETIVCSLEKEYAFYQNFFSMLNMFLEDKIKSSKLEKLYVPAERIMIPAIAGATLSLIQNKVPIPQSVLDFGAIYELARYRIKSYSVASELFNVGYTFENGIDQIVLPNQERIALSKAASGMQTAIPLLLAFNHFCQNIADKVIVIEEPESHLFPTDQKKLLELLVQKSAKTHSRLIITTHSPYILTAINNLIQAHNVSLAHPELKNQISEEIAESLWINYENVSAYYVSDGGVQDILNKESRLIEAAQLDAVSEQMGNTFDELLDLKYAD